MPLSTAFVQSSDSSSGICNKILQELDPSKRMDMWMATVIEYTRLFTLQNRPHAPNIAKIAPRTTNVDADLV